MNNPVLWKDPDGRCPWCVVIAAIILWETLYPETNNAPTDDYKGDQKKIDEYRAKQDAARNAIITATTGIALGDILSTDEGYGDDYCPTCGDGDDKPCFSGETEILSKKGSIKIENISVGDSVWSYNEEIQLVELSVVEEKYERKTNEIVKVYLQSKDRLIITTPEHPFYNGNEWIPSNKLSNSDSILTFNGNFVLIKKVIPKDSTITVFNFKVSKTHTYYVSDFSLLVHNTCKRGPKTKEQGGPHNEKIEEEAKKMEDEGWTITEGGGKMPEKVHKTPGGKKSKRRPDIVGEKDGKTKGRNIGKTKRDGTPIKREQEALDDLIDNSDLDDMDFVPYDK